MSQFSDLGSIDMFDTQSITQEGQRTYLNLGVPSNLGNSSGSNVNQPNANQPAPSFMKAFDIDLIGNNPQEIPDKFVKGKHPEWVYAYGTYQFVEPQGSTNSNKSIAFWDQYHNRPFFMERVTSSGIPQFVDTTIGAMILKAILSMWLKRKVSRKMPYLF